MYKVTYYIPGFPGGSVVRNSLDNAGGLGKGRESGFVGKKLPVQKSGSSSFHN